MSERAAGFLYLFMKGKKQPRVHKGKMHPLVHGFVQMAPDRSYCVTLPKTMVGDKPFQCGVTNSVLIPMFFFRSLIFFKGRIFSYQKNIILVDTRPLLNIINNF